MEKFGVDGIFTPEKPVFSAKGALVTNIAHIPAALTAVMSENACRLTSRPRVISRSSRGSAQATG